MGCEVTDSQSSSASDAPINEDNDLVRIKPQFFCPPGEAIAGVDGSGKPMCAFSGLDGLPALQAVDDDSNQFECPKGFKIQISKISNNRAEPRFWVSCFYERDSFFKPVAFGEAPFSKFECPKSLVLKGILANGQPLCVNPRPVSSKFIVTSATWNGVWEKDSFECPAGAKLERWNHSALRKAKVWDGTVALCNHTQKVEDVVLEQPVALHSTQKGLICEDDLIVVGFDDDYSPICGTPAKLPEKQPLFFGAAFNRDVKNPDKHCPKGQTLKMQAFFVGRERSENSVWGICKSE